MRVPHQNQDVNSQMQLWESSLEEMKKNWQRTLRHSDKEWLAGLERSIKPRLNRAWKHAKLDHDAKVRPCPYMHACALAPLVLTMRRYRQTSSSDALLPLNARPPHQALCVRCCTYSGSSCSRAVFGSGNRSAALSQRPCF